MSGSTTGHTADRWVALLAGHVVWGDPEEALTPLTRASAAAEILSLFACVTAIWLHRVDLPSVPRSTVVHLAPAVFIVASAVLVIQPIRILIGHPSRIASFTRQIIVRCVLVGAVVSATFAAAPNWAAMITWPFGIALGCDAAITAWAIGWDPTPLRSYWQYLRSPVHLGIVGGLLGVLADRGLAVAYRSALPIYVTFQVWGLIGVLTASWLGAQRRVEQHERDAAALDAARDEHRRAAHWLHDDICAELRLVTLRVQNRSIGLDEVGTALDNLDHQLRLRQLDELLESGAVRLAEVLQPYVRRAQGHGVRIDDVPSFDDASLVVDSSLGRVFGRAAAVLTSNALNAGARTIGFAVSHSDDDIILSVTDDAGGFPVDAPTAGRGLWSLEADDAVARVEISSVPDGSRVSVVIQRTDRTAHGATLAR